MKMALSRITQGILIAGLESTGGQASTDGFAIEEVIVTATKRATSTMDVPYNITATSAESMEKRGIVDFAKLAESIPGLAYTDTGSRDSGINSGLIIRGLNTSSSGFTDFATIASPTVSVYVGETPLFYNVLLKDIERVEILRGPQGTLYGSGSLGGTIRYISKKPDVEKSYAEIHSRLSQTEGSSGLNTDSHLVVNAAISDSIALRGVMGYVEKQGFIDADRLFVYDNNNQPISTDPSDTNSPNTEFSVDNSNGEITRHAKFTGLWMVNDQFTVSASYQYQEDNIDDRQVSNDTHVDGGDYTSLQRVREGADRDLDLFTLEVEADLGFATLTSATSKFESQSELQGDQSAAYYNEGYWTAYYYDGFPRESIIGTYKKDVDNLSQEFRMISNTDGDYDWILGAFYLKQEVEADNQDFHRGFYDWQDDNNLYYASQVRTLNGLNQPKDLYYALNQQVENTDKAIFGEITFHLTDVWQTTFGARFFSTNFENVTQNRSPLCGVFCDDVGGDLGIYGATQKEDIDDHILKFNTSYDLPSGVMVYTTLAQGFRNGGANGIPTSGIWAEPANLIPYTHDTALSFEVGAKGWVLDNRIKFNVAAFRIDWDDVILTTSSLNGFTILTNGETARSQGLEAETTIHLTESLSTTLGYAYTDAKLTDDFNTSGITGDDGDRLPAVPNNMFTLAFNYTQLLEGTEISYHLNGSYVDDVTTAFKTDTRNFTRVDGYSVINASIFWSVNDNFKLSVFADNLTDELASTNSRGSKYSEADPTRRDVYSYIMRPRTIGVGFKYSM